MTISSAESSERASRLYPDDETPVPATQPSTPPPTSPETPTALAGRARRFHRDASLAQSLAHTRSSSAYLAFLADVTTRAAPTAPTAEGARAASVRAKLDALRDAFSGPYRVEGARVVAPPMFRMTTHTISRAIEKDVDVLGARAGVLVPAASRIGQGAPRDLVRITQALIDDGRLPPGPGDAATRIRRMQWEHGIGVDCAGYVKQALLACSPRRPAVYPAGYESFRDLDTIRAVRFARLPIEEARAGDVITLDAVPPSAWGHNVIVYSSAIASPSEREALGARDVTVRAFLRTEGPHQVFEVDSSWGAGSTGASHGGFRRDTWLYDACSHLWGSFDPRFVPRRFVVSPYGPAGDAYHGTYRAR